jgi:hypothetical protein
MHIARTAAVPVIFYLVTLSGVFVVLPKALFADKHRSPVTLYDEFQTNWGLSNIR